MSYSALSPEALMNLGSIRSSLSALAQHLLRPGRVRALWRRATGAETLLRENANLKKALKKTQETHEKELAKEKETNKELLALADAERDETHAQNKALQKRVDHLETTLARDGKTEDDKIPANFDSLEDWSQKYLAGKVVLLSRAVRAAKKSPFQNAPLAYKALLTLRDFYVPMRRKGGTKRNSAYKTELEKLNLVENACFANKRSGEHGDEYIVDFKGRRRELDRHLKGSDSRDSRYGFRLYFFWDEGTEQAVVGSFPNHLRTRIS